MSQDRTGSFVLIVDDDSDVRDATAEALAIEGYEAVQAATGEEALRVLEGNELPCLILLDLLMPGMSGGAVLEHLRAHPRLRAVPVVVSTGAREKVAGANMLTKPFALEELLDIVRQHCGTGTTVR